MGSRPAGAPVRCRTWTRTGRTQRCLWHLPWPSSCTSQFALDDCGQPDRSNIVFCLPYHTGWTEMHGCSAVCKPGLESVTAHPVPLLEYRLGNVEELQIRLAVTVVVRARLGHLVPAAVLGHARTCGRLQAPELHAVLL